MAEQCRQPTKSDAVLPESCMAAAMANMRPPSPQEGKSNSCHVVWCSAPRGIIIVRCPEPVCAFQDFEVNTPPPHRKHRTQTQHVENVHGGDQAIDRTDGSVHLLPHGLHALPVQAHDSCPISHNQPDVLPVTIRNVHKCKQRPLEYSG